MFVVMWSLASGRTLRADVSPDQLTEDELIVFWADDFSPPSGRHAATVSPALAGRRTCPLSPPAPSSRMEASSEMPGNSGGRPPEPDPGLAGNTLLTTAQR